MAQKYKQHELLTITISVYTVKLIQWVIRTGSTIFTDFNAWNTNTQITLIVKVKGNTFTACNKLHVYWKKV